MRAVDSCRRAVTGYPDDPDASHILVPACDVERIAGLDHVFASQRQGDEITIDRLCVLHYRRWLKDLAAMPVLPGPFR